VKGRLRVERWVGYETVELRRSEARGHQPPPRGGLTARMPAPQRLLQSAATDRIRPLEETRRVNGRQPPADVASHEVERSLKRGAFWALGSQIAVQAIRFISVVVLARLLTPDDYGAAAIAVTIGSFSVILGDLGYGTALVQASAATQRWASTAFWCAIAAGIFGSGLAALGAYPAALVLDDPEVTALVIVGGLTLVLVAASSTSSALLKRSMSFGLIQSAGMVGWVAAAACSIAAAALGAGAWALVLQQVVLAAATSAFYILAARWRPSLEVSRDAARSLSRFAFPLTGGQAFGVLQPLVAALLIGHLVGIDELGIWTFALAIVTVPLSLAAYPLAQVIYAAFARMRESPERVAKVWLNGFTMLAAVVLPVLFGLIAIAPDLIPLAFGSQWVPAVTVVQILAVYLMSRTLQTWNSAVMDAAGKPHIAMFLNALVLVVTPPTIWLGSKYGIEGVAVAFSLAALICGEIPSFVITTRELSLRSLHVLGRLRGIVLASGAACIAVAFARHTLQAEGMGIEPRVALRVVLGGVIYLSCLTLFARGTARELLQMVRGLAPALRPKS
jgi:O-antigen/teichoic acid export membrane protein